MVASKLSSALASAFALVTVWRRPPLEASKGSELPQQSRAVHHVRAMVLLRAARLAMAPALAQCAPHLMEFNLLLLLFPRVCTASQGTKQPVCSPPNPVSCAVMLSMTAILPQVLQAAAPATLAVPRHDTQHSIW